MGQNQGLQTDKQVLVGRKNEVISELDFAVEIVTAAL